MKWYTICSASSIIYSASIMEPWPLASVQYATAVNPILSMKTEWLSSAHMLCLLRRAFLSKQFLTVYFHITFIGIFINCCESLTSSHLLSKWGDAWQLKIQWESPVTGALHQQCLEEVLLAVTSQQHLTAILYFQSVQLILSLSL